MTPRNIEPAHLAEQATEYARRRSASGTIEGRVYDRDEILALGDDWFLIGHLELPDQSDEFSLL